MKHDWVKTIRRGTLGLALLAALGSAVLPGGFLPKIAGRCGRELCNCAPEPGNCNMCLVIPSQPKPARHNLTFVPVAISGAEAPGMAMQLVFSGVLMPQKIDFAALAGELKNTAPASRVFALSCIASDIPTPPPRG